jgi:hypothetical protein
VRNESGESRYILLVGARGESVNTKVLPLVAEPVEVPGRLVRQGKHLILFADPERIRLLESGE